MCYTLLCENENHSQGHAYSEATPMRLSPLLTQTAAAEREPDNETLVLEALRATDQHPTAGELYDAVRLVRPRIGRATVYRALQRLEAAGRAIQVSRDSLGRRYDARVERHDHCVCSGCGRVLDVRLPLPIPPTALDELTEIAARSGFAASTFELRLYGRCAECQTADAEPTDDSLLDEAMLARQRKTPASRR